VIEEGKRAPDFELQSDTGETVKLSQVRGRPVGLYFYPKGASTATICSNNPALEPSRVPS
jgi:thioredoxin-dependent peroxiredoxin